MNEVQLKRAMADLLAGEPTAPVDARPALAHGKAARRARRLKFTAGSAAVAVALLAAAVPASRSFIVGDRAQPAAPKIKPTPTPSPLPLRTSPYVGYPDSIAVIGHTTALGQASDPDHLALRVQANSWATGTNPEVNSVYQRILAVHPAVKGRNSNLSDVDATIDSATIQAAKAVAARPPADLIVMQVLDYDLPCAATASDIANYRSGMVAALQTLRRGAPNSRVFVVSQFASPTTFLQAVTPDQRKEFAIEMNMSGFPCPTLTATGLLIPKNLKTFEDSIHAIEAAIGTACVQFEMCRYDNGAFGRVVEANEDIAPDFTHLTVKGQAKAAAVAWAALQHAGLIPASG
ncbi:MAG: hypothetical protein M3P23_15625 [Actinomycetota bacterium]|nr:hypothetical protein [Actinomycetota bacterium]